jgi:hypothetical protein
MGKRDNRTVSPDAWDGPVADTRRVAGISRQDALQHGDPDIGAPATNRGASCRTKKTKVWRNAFSFMAVGALFVRTTPLQS